MITIGVLILFLPAIIILAISVIINSDLSIRFLAMALLLLCLDQMRMAIVDLQNIAAIPASKKDDRLDWFRGVTLATIVVELFGFYLAGWHLGVGAIVVLLSQIGFNLFAKIQLEPQSDSPIIVWTWRDRWVVLVADIVGVGLISFWLAKIAILGMSIGLLGMVLTYVVIKYASDKPV
jgi:hypothetical protein